MVREATGSYGSRGKDRLSEVDAATVGRVGWDTLEVSEKQPPEHLYLNGRRNDPILATCMGFECHEP